MQTCPHTRDCQKWPVAPQVPPTHTTPLSRGDTLRGSCHLRFWWHLALTLPPRGDLQSADPTAFLPPGDPLASPFSCQPGLIIPLVSKHSAPFMGNIAGNKLPRASLRGCSGGREPPGQDLHRAARQTGGLARGSASQGRTEMLEQRLEGNKYQHDQGW